MLRSNRNRFLVGAVIFVAAFLLLELAGCSRIPTQATQSDQPVLLKRNLAAYKILGASARIDTSFAAAQGGVLSLLDVELTFPPNALPADTAVFIDIPDISIFENHFGTDGLVFNVPVKVVMSYRDADLSGINESNITLAWFNDVIGQWNSMSCSLDKENKTVTGYVKHFSAYALISDNK